jgi:predicted alpha/beta hydrolase
MQNGPKTMTSTHRPKSARPFANRSKQWTSNGARTDLRGSQNAQRTSPSSSPIRRRDWGRKLLPARQALLQINVLGPKNDIGDFTAMSKAI